MTKYTEVLSPADRDLANALVAQIMRSDEYASAVQWIKRAALCPRRTWKTCSVARVRLAMLKSTGTVVSEEAMVMALATSGFTARPIGGEESTNVSLRTLSRVERDGLKDLLH
jgi:hypothetical protein